MAKVTKGKERRVKMRKSEEMWYSQLTLYKVHTNRILNGPTLLQIDGLK